MDWEVEYYILPNGECPVEKFIDSISKNAQAKAVFIIDILRMKGNQLREPYSKKLHDFEKLFELRFRSAGNIYRIFYFPTSERKFILLHGFMKKSNETPQNEIERAIHYMNDYISRKEKHNGTQEN